MNKVDVVHIVVDNWEWLYVDGELELSGHSLDVGQVLEALEGKDINVVFSGWVDSFDYNSGLEWQGKLALWPDEAKEEMGI